MNKNVKNMKGLSKTQTIKMSFDDDDDFESDKSSSSSMNKSNSKSKTPVLDNFSKDLTKLADDGKIDPVVGRDKEIERISQILSRRKKNNPIVIGEPGCVDRNTIITVKKISDDLGHKIINI